MSRSSRWFLAERLRPRRWFGGGHPHLVVATLCALPFPLSTAILQADDRVPTLDLREFGAKGDGKTDDIAAFERALSELAARGGGRLFVPRSEAEYVVSRTIRVGASKLEIVGERGTRIRLLPGSHGGKTVHLIEIRGTKDAPVEDVALRDLELDADYWRQTDNHRPRAVWVSDARRVILHRVAVERAWVGITFGAGSRECEARDATVTSWHNDAFSVTGDGATGGAQDTAFLRCRAFDSLDGADGGLSGDRDNAFEIEDGAARVRLVECVVSSAGGDAFAVRSHAGAPNVTRDVSFFRCQVSRVRGRSFLIEGQPLDVRVENVAIVDCVAGGSVTLARNVSNVRIEGSRIEGTLFAGLRGGGDVSRLREEESLARALAVDGLEVLETELGGLVVGTLERGGDSRRITPPRFDDVQCETEPRVALGPDGISLLGVRVAPLEPLPARLRWSYHVAPSNVPDRDRDKHLVPLLPPHLHANGKLASSAAEWNDTIRPRLVREWTEILGKLEPTPDDGRWFGDVRKAAVRSDEARDGYRRLEVDLPIEIDFLQKHLLLVPEGQGDGPFPAVIAWTSTSPDWREPEKWWGEWLARNGFVVLTSWSFIRHYRDGTDFRTGAQELVAERFGRWAPLAKMAHDIRRETEYLASLPEVDAKRIGFIGFSLSAKAAVYAAAFLPELRATVSIDPHIALEGETNWLDPWYLDGKREIAPGRTVRDLFDADASRPGLERNHHELLALCAPRAFCLIACSTHREAGTPHSDNRQSAAYANRAREVYELLGVADRFRYVALDDGHLATSEAIDRAWKEFFARHLRAE